MRPRIQRLAAASVLTSSLAFAQVRCDDNASPIDLVDRDGNPALTVGVTPYGAVPAGFPAGDHLVTLPESTTLQPPSLLPTHDRMNRVRVRGPGQRRRRRSRRTRRPRRPRRHGPVDGPGWRRDHDDDRRARRRPRPGLRHLLGVEGAPLAALTPRPRHGLSAVRPAGRGRPHSQRRFESSLAGEAEGRPRSGEQQPQLDLSTGRPGPGARGMRAAKPTPATRNRARFRCIVSGRQ